MFGIEGSNLLSLSCSIAFHFALSSSLMPPSSPRGVWQLLLSVAPPACVEVSPLLSWEACISDLSSTTRFTASLYLLCSCECSTLSLAIAAWALARSRRSSCLSSASAPSAVPVLYVLDAALPACSTTSSVTSLSIRSCSCAASRSRTAVSRSMWQHTCGAGARSACTVASKEATTGLLLVLAIAMVLSDEADASKVAEEGAALPGVAEACCGQAPMLGLSGASALRGVEADPLMRSILRSERGAWLASLHDVAYSLKSDWPAICSSQKLPLPPPPLPRMHPGGNPEEKRIVAVFQCARLSPFLSPLRRRWACRRFWSSITLFNSFLAEKTLLSSSYGWAAAASGSIDSRSPTQNLEILKSPFNFQMVMM